MPDGLKFMTSVHIKSTQISTISPILHLPSSIHHGIGKGAHGTEKLLLKTQVSILHSEMNLKIYFLLIDELMVELL